jgi:hypothetical protein
MRLTFVSPSKLDLKAEKRNIVYTKTYNRGKGIMSAPGIYARTRRSKAQEDAIGKFVPVQVHLPPTATQAGCEIVLADGCRVIVPTQCDATWLGEILGALSPGLMVSPHGGELRRLNLLGHHGHSG